MTQPLTHAATLRCPACQATHHGRYATGFWQRRDGRWYHWCHGGRPGNWEPAIDLQQPQAAPATGAPVAGRQLALAGLGAED
jgi:hypothetical protein